MNNFSNKIKRIFKHTYLMPSSIVSRIKFFFAWEYGFVRFIYFFIIKKFKSTDKIHTATGIPGVKYQKKAFYDGNIPVYRPSERTMLPLFFLNSIPSINKNDLLVIGPRYETEILLAKSFGFKNVVGLDTHSYSPLIEVGDMHEMRFNDNSFNSIICGWTINYYDDPALAAKEMIRVMKKNAIVVLGVQQINENFDTSQLPSIQQTNQKFGKDRPDTKENLDKLFNDLERIHYIESPNKYGAVVIAAYMKT